MFRIKGTPVLTSTDVGIIFEHEDGEVEAIEHANLKSWEVHS